MKIAHKICFFLVQLNTKIYINFPPLNSCDIVGTKLGNIKKKLVLIADSLDSIIHLLAVIVDFNLHNLLVPYFAINMTHS